jgi:hypothetical protein
MYFWGQAMAVKKLWPSSATWSKVIGVRQKNIVKLTCCPSVHVSHTQTLRFKASGHEIYGKEHTHTHTHDNYYIKKAKSLEQSSLLRILPSLLQCKNVISDDELPLIPQIIIPYFFPYWSERDTRMHVELRCTTGQTLPCISFFFRETAAHFKMHRRAR